MIDALHFVAGMQAVPRGRLVSIDDGSLGDAGADERQRGGLAIEHARQRIPAALADHDNATALAGLVLGKATVAAILTAVCRLHVTPKIAAVDFGGLAFAADRAALQFFCHRLAELVRENECGLVRRAEIARKREHRFPLYLIVEDRDGREVAAEWQLV